MKREIPSKKVLNIAYWLTLLSFIIPTVYLTVKICITSNTSNPDIDYRAKAEYVLMLIQCVLGIIVIHLPAIISRKFNFEIPKVLNFIYIVFLYCAIFLGEVRNFYYVVPHWDDILHCISSVMTGLFGFMVVTILNHNQKVRMNLSPFFVALFAFCFSLAIGAVWEIYEFCADEFLGLNMQKFMLRDGTLLIGHEAIRDTMKDIMVDCFGAFLSTIIGYLSIKNKKGWIHEYITKDEESEEK